MGYSQPKPVNDGVGPAVAAKRLYGEYDLFGSNNYQTTGDLYTASQFGMAGFTFVSVNDRSLSGTYVPSALFPSGSSNANEAYAPAPANFNLHWYQSNGVEVSNNSNLAAEVVRVQIWGL